MIAPANDLYPEPGWITKACDRCGRPYRDRAKRRGRPRRWCNTACRTAAARANRATRALTPTAPPPPDPATPELPNVQTP